MAVPEIATYDALVVVSFGGPESPSDVIPFLTNALRGRNVSRARMLEVAEHYYRFEGKSPINEQNRELIRALKEEFSVRGPDLPVYWGNRNWHPLLPDTFQSMAADGVQRALAFTTSAYSSYSSCRQYLDDIERARGEVGPPAPIVDKIRAFFNHEGFIRPMVENTVRALHDFPPSKRNEVMLVFTAHSIPLSMASTSHYVEQLEEASRLVAEGVGHSKWRLVYQSRSGPPTQPWLVPDICDYLRKLHGAGTSSGVVVVPIGFVSDHMEVIYDLDTEARTLCDELDFQMIRVATVGTHQLFVKMIRSLVLERIKPGRERIALGSLGASPDNCHAGCCPNPLHVPNC